VISSVRATRVPVEGGSASHDTVAASSDANTSTLVSALVAESREPERDRAADQGVPGGVLVAGANHLAGPQGHDLGALDESLAAGFGHGLVALCDQLAGDDLPDRRVLAPDRRIRAVRSHSETRVLRRARQRGAGLADWPAGLDA
jgi:hypothetical protein